MHTVNEANLPITDTLYGKLHPSKQPVRPPKLHRAPGFTIRDRMTPSAVQALREAVSAS